VGLAAVEIGKALGARVIAAAGGAAKLALARERGADEAIDYRTADLRAAVRELTGGKGADVAFDPVGGDAFDACLRALAWEGRLVVVGFASGRIPAAPANTLLLRNCSVVGLYWGAYRKRDPAVIESSMAELFRWHEAGRIRPFVSHRYDLTEAASALAALARRESTGKVVIVTGRS
ncbi:MAG: zinc-binding dehydrogenase, partial [Alphaproteobacteria bacterium]